MAVESKDDRILIDNGDMFDGTRDQFRDCFFDNANDEQIIGWSKSMGCSVVINGVERYKPERGALDRLPTEC